MGPSLRILLIVGAILTYTWICYCVKKKQIMVEDSLFWMLFGLILIIIAIFPGIAYVLSRLFGFQSPSNFVFLCIIAILLIKEFRNSAKISLLKNRLNQLAETVGLDQNENERQDQAL
jgi:hypothetical protein